MSILAAVLVLVVLWSEARRDVFPKRFHTVEEGAIYRSGKLTPAAFRTVVEDADIRTIVDLGAWEPESAEEALARAVARELEVDRVVFDLEGDASGDPVQYLHALRIMNDPHRQPVLVHCGAGTERTGFAVILQRCVVQGMDVEDAYDEAQGIGHSSSRNPHLREVMNRWLQPIAEAYEQGLEELPASD